MWTILQDSALFIACFAARSASSFPVMTHEYKIYFRSSFGISVRSMSLRISVFSVSGLHNAETTLLEHKEATGSVRIMNLSRVDYIIRFEGL